jgi:hypothetical protein
MPTGSDAGTRRSSQMMHAPRRECKKIAMGGPQICDDSMKGFYPQISRIFTDGSAMKTAKSALIAEICGWIRIPHPLRPGVSAGGPIDRAKGLRQRSTEQDDKAKDAQKGSDDFRNHGPPFLGQNAFDQSVETEKVPSVGQQPSAEAEENTGPCHEILLRNGIVHLADSRISACGKRRQPNLPRGIPPRATPCRTSDSPTPIRPGR